MFSERKLLLAMNARQFVSQFARYRVATLRANHIAHVPATELLSWLKSPPSHRYEPLGRIILSLANLKRTQITQFEREIG
jgi:hypothetical protein